MTTINYKHPNEHIFIIASRPRPGDKVALGACTCGYETRIYEDIGDKCPKCNSKIYNILTSQTRTNGLSHVSGFEITKEKAIINYRKIELSYIQDSKNYKNDSLTINEIKTDFVIEYETDKKGQKKFKPKMIITEGNQQEVKKLLKSSVEYQYAKENTETTAYSTLRRVSGNQNNLPSIIWSLHNKYKYSYDAIQKGFLNGYYGEISSLKEWNKLIKSLNDKEIEALRYVYDMENSGYTYSSSYNYILREFCGLRKKYKDEQKLLDFVKVKNFIHKDSDKLEQVIPLHLSNYNTDIAELIYDYGFKLEEIIELFAHAERQAFNLTNKFTEFMRGCKIYKTLNIEIDKKPRELAIYLAKMTAINNLISFYGNKKFSIKDEDITYNFILQNSILPVKTVYENFGFKGLDVLLINHHMNNYVAYGLCINEVPHTNTPELVAFTNKFANAYNSDLKDGFLPKAILTIDGKLIEDKDEIKELLIDTTKNKLLNKGETTC